jgi:hypothetical protein
MLEAADHRLAPLWRPARRPASHRVWRQLNAAAPLPPLPSPAPPPPSPGGLPASLASSTQLLYLNASANQVGPCGAVHARVRVFEPPKRGRSAS